MSDNKTFNANSKLGELVACLEMATDHLSEIMLRQAIKQMLEREYGAVFDETEKEVDSDGWVQWSGGGMPVPLGVKVDVRHRSGGTYLNCKAGVAGSYAETWSHSGLPMDSAIISYRIVK